jgi:hypothetical protein
MILVSPNYSTPKFRRRKHRVLSLGVPDFLYAALDTTACAAFITETRMKCAEATSWTGNPGWSRPCLRFQGIAGIRFLA